MMTTMHLLFVNWLK